MRNKYCYLYILQGDYGFGWEDLSAYDKAEPEARRKIRNDKKAYQENEGGVYRIIQRRELA